LAPRPRTLGYIGLYLRTLKSSWDVWWLLLGIVRNLKGKPWISFSLLTSLPQILLKEGWYLLLPATPIIWTREWLQTLFTYQRVAYAIDTFAPYKSLGVDKIFPALLREGQEVLIPHLVRIFRACLTTGYVPFVWRQVKVVFIPKPGRNS
jgi:hypothetical protein